MKMELILPRLESHLNITYNRSFIEPVLYRFILGFSSSFQQNVSLFQVVVDETFKLIFSQILLLVNYGVCLPKCCFFYCKSSRRSFPHKMLFLRKSCKGEENSLLCSAHAVQLSICISVYVAANVQSQLMYTLAS